MLSEGEAAIDLSYTQQSIRHATSLAGSGRATFIVGAVAIAAGGIPVEVEAVRADRCILPRSSLILPDFGADHAAKSSAPKAESATLLL